MDRGLGKALLLACLIDVADAGHSHCTISWIGPREFYDRVAGIESTIEYRSYRHDLEVQP